MKRSAQVDFPLPGRPRRIMTSCIGLALRVTAEELAQRLALGALLTATELLRGHMVELLQERLRGRADIEIQVHSDRGMEAMARRQVLPRRILDCLSAGVEHPAVAHRLA